MPRSKYPISFLFLHISKLLKDKMTEDLRKYDLHFLQARVLMVLLRVGTATQIDLANRLYVKPATMSNVLKKMEHKMLITRCKSENDDRSLRIRLTPKGQKTTECVHEVFGRIEANVLSTIPQGEVRHIKLLLRTVRSELGGKPPMIESGNLETTGF